jgi:F-type H+-transporting ATPase subunit b
MDVIVQQIGAQMLSAVAVIAAPQNPILGQVGELLKGAIPTSLLFLVLVIAYEFLVHRPMTATLARRRALTQGAMEEAQKAVAAAEAKTTEYTEKLRLARAEAFKVREQRIKQWNVERDAALDAARKSSHQRVSQAIAQLQGEADEARKGLEASAAELAQQAMRAVLPAAAGGSR